MRCETAEFFDLISDLLRSIAYSGPLDVSGSNQLKHLLDRWDSIECPAGGCHAGNCSYAKPIDWVEFRGYTCLFDLIQDLDQSSPIERLPVKPGFEILRAEWAKRPGHYNP